MPRKHETVRRMRRRYLAFSRETDLSRRVELQNELRSILLATNGKNSEVDYFQGIKTESWINVGRIVIQFVNGDPASLVIRAAEIRDQNDYDEVWVVCDLDQYDVTSAIAEANVKDIGFALSVPSFEVWLILHLSAACPGFNEAKHVNRYLKGILPSWDKAKPRFADFRPGVWQAVARAKQLGEPPEANPSTAVWMVIESLANAADDTPEDAEGPSSQGTPGGAETPL